MVRPDGVLTEHVIDASAAFEYLLNTPIGRRVAEIIEVTLLRLRRKCWTRRSCLRYAPQ